MIDSMNAPIRVSTRLAVEADKDFLFQLCRAAYHDVVVRQFGKWDDIWQREHFADKWGRMEYRVVEHGGKPVGTTSVSEEADHVFLNEIQILPAFQSQGIGTSLVTDLIEQARRGAKDVRLRVLKQSRLDYWDAVKGCMG